MGKPGNDWEDLDVRDWVDTHDHKPYKPDIVADCRSVPRKDGTYEVVLLHSVLEHFNKIEYKDVLKECYRLLKDDGRLILSVPDMLRVSKGLIERPENTNLINLIYGEQDFSENQHKWGWTEKTLITDLKSIGFITVSRLKSVRYPQELYMEATK